ncbi:hypothetical protein AURDEDRAFT_181825 [Auricularia subglabra TFB-10046 SS5]|nr:hypothetical protein AURDEDRAFT_181825 [Auricularia subglabra TFB-10046 SS5]
MAQRLPAELWGRIVDCLSLNADLRTCALLSSAINPEAERVLYNRLAFSHIVPVLRFRLALKRSHPDRRERRLRCVRLLALRLTNISPGFSYYPDTYGSLQFLFRRAILREIAALVVALPNLTFLELDLPQLPGASESFDVTRLLQATFSLSTLTISLPYTPALVAFLTAQAPTLKHLAILPPSPRSIPPNLAQPSLDRLIRLDTYEELAGLWSGVKNLRVRSRIASDEQCCTRALPLLKLHAESLDVLRVSAAPSPQPIYGIAEVLPALKGLTVDIHKLPDPATDPPWDHDLWFLVFLRFKNLVNFRLRFRGHRARHVWDARKPRALESWHRACPTLTYVAFPGEESRWARDSRTGTWRRPSR